MKFIKTLAVCLIFLAMTAAQTFAGDIRTSSDLLDSIAACKGKQVVIVNFYASWCPPCREEIPHLINIRNKFSEDTVKIIAVNLDESKEIMQEFNQKAGINYNTYHDSTGDIQGFFSIQSIPFNLIYSKNGKAVYASPGSIPESRLTELVEYGLLN